MINSHKEDDDAHSETDLAGLTVSELFEKGLPQLQRGNSEFDTGSIMSG
jgi:hypothetical protein